MTIDAFQSLQNGLGLVPMVIENEYYPGHPRGSIAGFPPDAAFKLYTDGDALPCDEHGAPIKIGVARRVEAKTAEPGPQVFVPDDWETLHHLQRLALAKKLAGDGRSFTVESADQFIRTELQLREGNEL